MKRGKLLNSDISAVISKMGHTDSITIADSGLPIPPNTERIDIALTFGIPSFIQVLENILLELCVEKVVIADEMIKNNSKIHSMMLTVFEKYRKESGFKAELNYVKHSELKHLTEQTKAVVRTGEITPYSNIILYSGVVF